MSNPARQRCAQTPVCTSEAGTPSCVCIELLSPRPWPAPVPTRRPHRAPLTQALPEVARDAKCKKASCESSESGRSRAAPGAQSKQVLLGAAGGWRGSPDGHTESWDKRSLYSWDKRSFSRTLQRVLEHHQHPHPRPPHTLLGQAEGPGQALARRSAAIYSTVQGTTLAAIYICIYYWPTPDPGWTAGPWRARTAHARPRRARVLLKDTAGRLPEVPVLPAGSGFTCQ